MPTLDERVDRWEQRQELMIETIRDLTDVVGIVRDVLAEMKAALERPPSNDLPDLLRTLVTALGRMDESVHRQEQVCSRLAARMVDLPAQIAQAVQTGEVPRSDTP